MNKDNVLKVADAIEQHSIPDLGFNMGTFGSKRLARPDLDDQSGNDCGTIACIAGWVEAVRLGTGSFQNDGHVDERSRVYLGLTREDADRLFLGFGTSMQWRRFCEIKPQQAVAVLRNFAETGEVDWTIADKVPA